jgi:hypothetical protein
MKLTKFAFAVATSTLAFAAAPSAADQPAAKPSDDFFERHLSLAVPV